METVKKSSLLKYLYMITFTISGIFSVMLLSQLGTDKISTLLFSGIAVVMEFGKGVVFFTALSGRYTTKITRMLFVIWVVLVAISLMASMSAVLNASNEIANSKIKNSTEFQMTEEQYSTAQKNVNSAQTELDELNAKDINTIIAEDETIIDLKKQKQWALDNDYITHETMGANYYQGQIDSREKALRDEYNNKIEQLENKITTNTEKMETSSKDVKEIDTASIKDTKGYRAILATVVDLANKGHFYKYSEWTVDQMELLFYFIVSLMVEILSCMFYFMYKTSNVGVEEFNADNIIANHEEDKSRPLVKLVGEVKPQLEAKRKFTLKNKKLKLKDDNSDTEIKEKTKLVDLSKKKESSENGEIAQCQNSTNLRTDLDKTRVLGEKPRKIGFSMEVDNKKETTQNPIKNSLNSSDNLNLKNDKNNVMKYLSCLYNKKNWYNGSVPGYQKISKLTGIGETNSRHISGALKTLGITTTEGRKTNVNCNMNEALKEILKN